MILYHTKEFEIHENNHYMNVFLLIAHYIKKTSSDQPFDCSMDFFKMVRKEVTPIREAISCLDLSLDKDFDQIDSILSELISLIGLITEKQLFIQKCITKHTNNCQIDCLRLQKRDP